jgi:uncharacterized delta-60 repeat protein
VHRLAIGITSLALAALASFPVAAGASALDPSFDEDGRVTAELGGPDAARGIVALPGGKVVAVGDGGLSHDVAAARFDEDGSLDDSFSGDGVAFAEFPHEGDTRDAVLAPNGDVVTLTGIGFAHPSRSGVGLTGFSPSGELDSGFGDAGQAQSDGARGFAMALDTQGRFVVAGCTDGGRIALLRFLDDGSPDPSFSGDGVSVSPRLTAAGDLALDVAVDPDGRIVVTSEVLGGKTGTVRGVAFLVARYRANGHLDSSFSGDGHRQIRFDGYRRAEPMAVAVTPLGRILAAGSAQPKFSPDGPLADFAVVRLRPTGKFDPSFSDDGRRTVNLHDQYGSTWDEAHEVLAVPGGGVALVGWSGLDFGAAVLRKDGALDSGFSGDGREVTGFAGAADAFAGTLDSDGRLVAAGTRGYWDSDAEYLEPDDFALARYVLP